MTNLPGKILAYARFQGSVSGVVEYCPGYVTPTEAVERIQQLLLKLDAELREASRLIDLDLEITDPSTDIPAAIWTDEMGKRT